MQINKINYAMQTKATSFGNSHKCKDNDCCAEPKAEAKMVKIPAALYKALLGIAMLSATAGGTTSCSSDPVGPVDKPVEDTLTTNKVQKQLMQMVDVLGLEIKTKSSMDRMAQKLDQMQGVTNSVVKTGDIVEFGYHDSEQGCTYKFQISEGESTKDKMIYYGAVYNDVNKSGVINPEPNAFYRKIISTTENGIMVKTELKDGDIYIPRRTHEYVTSGNIVEDYACKSDGSKVKDYIYKPKNQNSLIKENPRTGESCAVDNISIFQK